MPDYGFPTKPFATYASNLPSATAGVASLLGVTVDGPVRLFATYQTAKGKGATGDGVATEDSFLADLYADAAEIYIDDGVFNLSTESNLAEKDVHVVLHPNAKFATAPWDMGALTKAIGNGASDQSIAWDAFFKDVTTEYDLFEHAVGRSIFMKASSPYPTVVSLYSNCEVVAPGARGFGANFGVYVTGAGTGIAVEIDSHVTDAAGLSYGLVIDSVGSYASQAGIVIQPNGANSPFLSGISFNNASGNDAVTNNAIQFLNAGEAQRFLFAHADMMFTSAVMDTNVLVIGPSVAGYDSLFRFDASSASAPKLSTVGSATNIAAIHQTKGTGDFQFLGGDGLARFYVRGTTGATYARIVAGNGGVTVEAAGTDINADLILHGKGNAGGKLQAGGGAIKFEWGDTGISFYGAAETAKQTITGSRAGNAAVASIASALAAIGIFTDSTTA